MRVWSHRVRTAAVAAAGIVALAACSGTEAEGEATTTAAVPTSAAATVPDTTSAVTDTTGFPVMPIAAAGWTMAVDGAPWGGRAGLRVVALDGADGQQLFVLGGRTPKDSPIPGVSDLWGDVWRSDDAGVRWTKVLESGAAFAPRAYFQALVHDGAMYVIGGQDFGFPASNFYNDVWRSADGVTWERMTEAAPWVGRAGLMAASFGDAIYVFGGSRNDDSAIIGPTGPAREYFNDVWRSTDGGATWEEVAAAAPWPARAGGAVAVHEGALYLLGGEVGFICQPFPGCDPPYFNDVWRTTDGDTWELVAEEAAWSSRPGHQCESLDITTPALSGPAIVCFGGFGQLENPIDVWATSDGATWAQLDSSPWNAATSEQGRYDFDSTVAVVPGEAGDVPAIITVGGDRETFEFGDPENWLRVDDDVWWFVIS
ncbi:MAG: hypothetical protein ACKO27_07635 [Ilumatobacteraceae bacterium]